MTPDSLQANCQAADLPDAQVAGQNHRLKSWLGHCWHGRAPLWQAFWVLGLLGLLLQWLLILPPLVMAFMALESSLDRAWLEQTTGLVYFLLTLPVLAIWIVCVLRCSSNTQTQVKGVQPWRWLALLLVGFEAAVSLYRLGSLLFWLLALLPHA
ncbi:MAG: hypothetical protein SFZ03_01200 [Candidatus Melainabacteria bacterium]|nr:hypothetical protein [Candidatus Melainabacteria bacterium]